MAAFAALREPINQALVPCASLIGQLRRARTALQTDPNFRGSPGAAPGLDWRQHGYAFFHRLCCAASAGCGRRRGYFPVGQHRGQPGGLHRLGSTFAWRGNRLRLRIGAGLGVLVLAFALMAWPLSRLLGVQMLIVLIFILVGVRDAAVGVSLGPLLLDMAPPAAVRSTSASPTPWLASPSC